MTSKYAEWTTEALVAEAKKRREAGRSMKLDLRKPDTIRAALELDDAAAPTKTPVAASSVPAATPTPAPAANASSTPEPAKAAPVVKDEPPVVKDEPPVVAPSAKPAGTLTDQVPVDPIAPTEATQPAEDVFAKGHTARNKQDGYLYQVVKVAGDELKPYKARVPAQSSGHPGFFWEGSAEEYRDTFDKE